MDPFVRLTMGT